jgi:hypothetical protein
MGRRGAGDALSPMPMNPLCNYAAQRATIACHRVLQQGVHDRLRWSPLILLARWIPRCIERELRAREGDIVSRMSMLNGD